jgi:WD40 repeat protein
VCSKRVVPNLLPSVKPFSVHRFTSKMIPSRHRLGYSQAHGFKDENNRGDPLGPHIDDITAISFSEDGKVLLSSSSDTTAKLWKTQSGKPAVLCRTLDHAEAISCIACSPIEHGWRTCKVATVGGDGRLRIWNFSLDSQLGGPGGNNPDDPPIKDIACHDDVVWACQFNPLDETKVSTASSDCTVKTWDITTGECVATYTGHLSWVTSVAYNHGATLLCSASKDCSVRLWDVAKNGRQVMELWGHEYVPPAFFCYVCHVLTAVVKEPSPLGRISEERPRPLSVP